MMNGTTATPGMPVNGFAGQERIGSLQLNLAYNEMAMGANGNVPSRANKADLRTRHGYCRECEGIPIQLYAIKSRG